MSPLRKIKDSIDFEYIGKIKANLESVGGIIRLVENILYSTAQTLLSEENLLARIYLMRM